MGNSIAESISMSSRCFEAVVWPVLSPLIGGGWIHLVEGNTTDQVRKNLDVIAGIDAWHVLDGGKGMQGIASRIQPDDGSNHWPYNTFTIRSSLRSGNDTELQKRYLAVNSSNLLYPALTVQAYVTSYDGCVVSLGAVSTKDMYSALPYCNYDERYAYGGNSFLAVNWSELEKWGVNVMRYQGGNE